MRRAASAAALAGVCAVALAGGAEGAKSGGYRTIAEGAYVGGGVFDGVVRTRAKGKINGRSIRRRCAAGRQVDSGTHDSSVHLTVHTDRTGHWTFTLPEEPGRTIKVFVVAKPLPRGFCTAATLKLWEPEPISGP